MKKYFKDVTTLDELRKQYRDLLKKYHPDNGGSEDDCKSINVEYDELFKCLKNKASETVEKEYDVEFDSMIKEVLSRIIHLDITIEIIGTWVWVSGNTYVVRDELKEAGFKFSRNKRMWYWNDGTYAKKSYKSLKIDEIKDLYGCTEVKVKKVNRIA